MPIPPSPKQAAYLQYLGLPVPETLKQARTLIAAAHDSSDPQVQTKCGSWKHERAWLYPDLYPGLLEEYRSRRAKHLVEYNNSSRGVGCPLKRLTIAKAEQLLQWMDYQQPNWDRHFYSGEFQFLSHDVFDHIIVPAVTDYDPTLFKRGYAPKAALIKQQFSSYPITTKSRKPAPAKAPNSPSPYRQALLLLVLALTLAAAILFALHYFLQPVPTE